ncbi:GPCR kinase [Tanacetum coccineum]
MACSVPHTYDEIKAIVDKQIEEDKARQLVIMNLVVEYDNAYGVKDNLRTTYEKCNDIPQETQYMKKIVEDMGDDEDFKSGSWVSATDYVNANGGISSLVLRNLIGDLTVTMKDLSGTISGTIHHKVIGEGAYRKDITVGAALILANVSVFSLKPSMHYINITKRKVVKVFRKDTVPENESGSGYM